MENIKKLREENNMTQQQLADKINATQQAICKYESGKSIPSVDMLERIADYFNTSMDYVVGKSQSKDVKYMIDSMEFSGNDRDFIKRYLTLNDKDKKYLSIFLNSMLKIGDE